MAITFAKAPLIEIIAELRWIPQGIKPFEPVGQQEAVPRALSLGGTKQDEFYARVGTGLYRQGFDRAERLIPTGFPTIFHQPVYRFRSEREDRKSVLYQVGSGGFSVHGIPPYHSWAKFSPFIELGNQILLESRVDADAEQPFTQVALRYIDFFGEEMTQGRDAPSFMREVFGISCTLPDGLTNAATSKPKTLFTKVVLPIEIGELSVSVGNGKFQNQAGVVLDNQVSSSAEIAPDFHAIMKMLNSAYAVIHDMFLELTRPIHELMQLQGANNK